MSGISRIKEVLRRTGVMLAPGEKFVTSKVSAQGVVRPDQKSVGHRVVIFGSSSTERNDVVIAGGVKNAMAIGYFHWLNAFSGNRFVLSRNAGVSGDRVSSMAARIDADVRAYSPDVVIYQVTPNDIYADLMTAQASFLAHTNLIKTLIEDGAFVEIMLPHIWGSAAALATATSRREIIRLYEYFSEWVKSRPGVVIVDTLAEIVDPASATGEPIAGMLADGTHTTSAGAAKIGWALWRGLQNAAPAVPWEISTAAGVWAATDAETMSRSVINPNPLMLGSGGTNLTGSSGAVATDCIVLRESGAGTVVNTLVASPRGVGFAQRMTMTATAPNTRFTIQQQLTNATARPLDGIYKALANIKITQQTKLRSVYIWVSYNNSAFVVGGLFRSNSGAQNVNDQSLPWVDLPGVITPATYEFRPSDAIASYTSVPTLNVSAIFDDSGSAVMDVFDMTFLKRVGS